MNSQTNSVLQDLQCDTCRLIRIRDPNRKSTFGSSNGAISSANSKPFRDGDRRYPTLSYKTTVDFFHDELLESVHKDIAVCDFCDHWFYSIFARDWGDVSRKDGGSDQPIARISLGTVTEIQARLECAVCQTLCQFLLDSPSAINHTRALSLQLEHAYKPRSCGYQASGTILYEDEGEFPNPSSERIWNKFPDFDLFRMTDTTLNFTTMKVNWERLRQWHAGLPTAAIKTPFEPSVSVGKASPLSETLPTGFCLINVSKACLIETDGVRVPSYAALSYVWGKSDEEIVTTRENFESLKVAGCFREDDVPLLFQDAFEVCSHLGIDYLWIDRICIVQDDIERKSAQLEAMGHIYSRARITIVSHEPHFISQGLPGVSMPRKPPLKYLVGDRFLVHKMRYPRSTSTWETRGWTYQEGLLSRNVLIFGQEMVYMYSRSSDKAVTEGFISQVHDKPDYISSNLVAQDKQYSDQVTEYSARKLTFSSDKINAFLGVLKSFGEHRYGLPERIIDQAVLWRHDRAPALSSPIDPRESFPSWSWISTIGRIEYSYLPSKYRPLFSLASWAIVQLDQASNKPLVEALDQLKAEDHSETLDQLHAIRSHMARFEAEMKLDPVVVAMAANLCERYRFIQQGSSHPKKSNNGSNTSRKAVESSTAESMWWSLIRFCFERVLGMLTSGDKSLSEVTARMNPFKRAPWFQGLDDLIRQIPEDVRLETLMRIAKPPLPDLIQKFSMAEMEAVSKPGRIVVHAPRKTIQLKYTQVCFGGTHIWKIGCNGKRIGVAEISEPWHQEVMASISQDTDRDKVEAYCVALSLMAFRIRYDLKNGSYHGTWMTSDSHSTIFVMIASMFLMSCSHRLGLGYIDYPDWASLGEVPIETTILD